MARKESKKTVEAGGTESLNKTVASIEKMFGTGAIMTLGSENKVVEGPVISTGSLGLDIALGTGGMPAGRICEVYGPESSGKTTMCLHLVASSQRNGGTVAFIDAEHALDPVYAKKLGVDLDTLLVSQPDSGEQALEICEMLVRSGSVDLVIVDSVAALVPRAELEGDMGDSHVGLQARLMSQALRKLTAVANKSHTTIVFINQIREKIGVMFGSPETTPGGRALKFYSSVRIDIRRISTIKKGDDPCGNRTRTKVVKNKMAAPFRMAEFDIVYNEGVNRVGEIVDLGVELGFIDKSGSWYSRGKDKIGQGRDQAMAYLREHPDVMTEIETMILREKCPNLPQFQGEVQEDAENSGKSKKADKEVAA